MDTTHDATTFTITSSETGQLLGLALVCPAARYASVLGAGEERIARRFGSPATWQAVEREIASGVHQRTLPVAGALARLLTVGNPSTVVRLLHALPVTGDTEQPAAMELDRQLRGLRSPAR